MMKKLLALLLTACMVLCLFAGCGNSAADTASSAPAEAEEAAASEAAAPAETEEPAPAEADEAAPVEEASAAEEASATEEAAAPEGPANEFYAEHYGVVDYDLPMFEEGELSLTCWWIQLGAMGGAEQPLKNDLPFWQTVQEELGVELDFKQASEAVGNEQYNLMVASGDMTDLIWESNCGARGATSVYTGGYDKAIEDDVYVDLTDIIPEYAPNYWAIVSADENLQRDLATDTGKLYGIAMIYDQAQGVREGPLVRTDYLEATGKDMPTTTTGWMEVFKAMKANGVTYPAGISSTGDIRGGLFANAFGTSAGHAYKIDNATNKLVYDGTSDELRAFVEYFRELWTENLIDPDYMNLQMFDTSGVTSGANALFGGMQTDLVTFKEDYGFDLAAVPCTTVEGTVSPNMISYEYHYQRTSSAKDVVITTCCQDVENAVKFLDWFYSTDGSSACNFGFYGEGDDATYDVVDGVKEIKDFMIERNEDLVNYEVLYSLDEGPGLLLVNKKMPAQQDYVIEAKQIWLDTDYSESLYTSSPTLSFTAEEAEDMAAVNSDISTYVSEQISMFMTCQKDLTDETWDAYCAEIEAMGLETLNAYYDAAYERYLAR